MKRGGNSRRPAQNLDISATVEIGRNELGCKMPEHHLAAETAEIEVEVAMDRHKLADIDPGGCSQLAQPVGRVQAGCVAAAWIGDWRLVGPFPIETGALDAGNPTAGIG